MLCGQIAASHYSSNPDTPLRGHRRRRLCRLDAVYLIGPNQKLAATRGLLVRRNRSLAPIGCEVSPDQGGGIRYTTRQSAAAEVVADLQQRSTNLSRRHRSALAHTQFVVTI